MNEKPILFSTEMVQAILEGRKTQTRRKVKHLEISKSEVAISAITLDGKRTQGALFQNELGSRFFVKCPHGNPGDFIYVRETWADASLATEISPNTVAFKADYSEEVLKEKANKGIWKPGIHMPKSAARIWLKIKRVRIERLNTISEQDAIAEGVKFIDQETAYKCYDRKGLVCINAKTSFETLWKGINGNYSWELNPWVWVIEFEVASTTGRP